MSSAHLGMTPPHVSVGQVIPGLHPAAGGPSRTIVQLCDALARRPDVRVTLVSQRRWNEPVMLSEERKVLRRIAESRSGVSLKTGLPLRAELLQVLRGSSSAVLHSNGLWTAVNHWVTHQARRWQVPLIVQPHGMLEPWALAYRGWKKRLALSLYQRRDLESASLFIATAEQEAESIRRFGLRQPIAVIPNGVELAVGGGEEILTHRNTARTALFLSRVHPKKGLLNLVNAWGELRPRNWRLVIAGPDEDGHLAQVMSSARQQGITECVEYVGEVEGQRKAALYRDADLFVLPTFSENFGVVVAEALAYGLPVITTRGAPWTDLERFGCGWWIDTGVGPLVETLREAMSLPEDERKAMGERGRRYVQRYDWNVIARQTAEVYRWVLARGPKPDCVRTD
ncbi:MAG: glycosyltransferase [Nitrospira sp.]|nr:glycosyltransferase [Nitrospira sp.]